MSAEHSVNAMILLSILGGVALGVWKKNWAAAWFFGVVYWLMMLSVGFLMSFAMGRLK